MSLNFNEINFRMLLANISRILTRRNNLYLVQSSLTRKLATTSLLAHGDYEWEEPKSPEDIVNMTYIDRDNIEHKIRGKVGDNVLFLAHRHDIDIEGACEAALVSPIYSYPAYIGIKPQFLYKNLGLLYMSRVC